MICGQLVSVKVWCKYEIEAPVDRTGCVVSACYKFIVKMKVVAGIHNL